MATIVLKHGRAKPLWFGHPWLFSEAVARIEGSFAPGDEVTVVSSDQRFIGKGFANPKSQLRVRIASLRDEPLDDDWLAKRLSDARDLRRRIGLPSASTSAYRLVNSEGDWLSGLVVDVYGDALAIQFTGLAMKQREEQIYRILAEMLGPKTIFEVAAGGFAQIEGFVSSGRVVKGDSRARIPCRENGFDLEVEPLSGQKTGYFLDQRENRAEVAKLAKSANVLDLYCYAGGFALAACRGGASSVTAVDVSPRALERAESHFRANGLSGLHAVEDDVFRYLEKEPAQNFDIVICDPPKFARAHKDVPTALKGYQRLNALALKTLRAGGLLCTSSCSQLVDLTAFERVLAGAAKDAHRRLQVLSVASQAPCHVVPVAFTEGRYLKFLVSRVLD